MAHRNPLFPFLECPSFLLVLSQNLFYFWPYISVPESTSQPSKSTLSTLGNDFLMFFPLSFISPLCHEVLSRFQSSYLSPFTSSTISLLFLRYLPRIDKQNVLVLPTPPQIYFWFPSSFCCPCQSDPSSTWGGSDLNNPKPSLCNAARQSAIFTPKFHHAHTPSDLKSLFDTHIFFLLFIPGFPGTRPNTLKASKFVTTPSPAPQFYFWF